MCALLAFARACKVLGAHVALAAMDAGEQRFGDDLPPNTHEWDEEWKSHGKKSPWDDEEETG